MFSVCTACPATTSDCLISSKWCRHQWILQILKDYPSACYVTSEWDPPPRLQPFKLSFICLLVCFLRSADHFDYLNIWKLSHGVFLTVTIWNITQQDLVGGRHSKEKSPTLLIRTCARNYQMTPSERGVLYTQRQDFSPSPKARATALHNIHSRLKKKKKMCTST